MPNDEATIGPDVDPEQTSEQRVSPKAIVFGVVGLALAMFLVRYRRRPRDGEAEIDGTLAVDSVDANDGAEEAEPEPIARDAVERAEG